MNAEQLEALVTKYRELDHEGRPFVLGVMGDFAGNATTREAVRERRFVDLRWETFGTFIAAVRPRLALTVPDVLGDEDDLSVELEFSSLDDFHPRAILQNRDLAQYLDAMQGNQPESVEDKFKKLFDSILRHQDLQQLEASWRGLHHLVTRVSGGPAVRIRVLDLPKRELGKTLQKFRGIAWDQSPLFKRIYEDEFGTLGGHPFSLVIGDYEFTHDLLDVGILQEIAQIAAASHTVFLAAAAPRLLGESSLAGVHELRDPGRLFHSADYAAWRALCDSPDARYLALALPRVLLRAPRVGGDPGGQGDKFNAYQPAALWGNPAFVVGARLFEDFARHRCFARLADLPGGAVIAGLPLTRSRTGEPGRRSSLEREFVPRMRAQLESAGLIPLYRRGQSERVSYARAVSLASSVEEPGVPDDLPWTMLVGRTVHGLKAWQRTMDETEYFLQAMEAWLRREETSAEEPGLAERIRHPLHVARLQQDVDQRELLMGGSLQFRYQFLPHKFEPD